MAATKMNIEIEQGATFSQTIDLLNTDGTNFIVTGWTGSGQIRKHYAANTAYSFMVALANGAATISMSANVTDTLAGGLYVYDVEIENSGVVRRIASGMATVLSGVTR